MLAAKSLASMHASCTALVWLANAAANEHCAVYIVTITLSVLRSSHLRTWQIQLDSL